MDDNMVCKKTVFGALTGLEAIVDAHLRFMVPLSSKNKEDFIPKQLQLFGGILYYTPTLMKWLPKKKVETVRWAAR
jgi:hypothetical protein